MAPTDRPKPFATIKAPFVSLFIVWSIRRQDYAYTISCTKIIIMYSKRGKEGEEILHRKSLKAFRVLHCVLWWL